MSKIDKDDLYGTFNRSAERRARLHEMALAKALDLPLSEGMNITTNNQSAGMSKTAALCIVLLMLGSGGMGLAAFFQGWFDRPSVETPPPIQSQEFEVRFWAEDGTELDVQELPVEGR